MFCQAKLNYMLANQIKPTNQYILIQGNQCYHRPQLWRHPAAEGDPHCISCKDDYIQCKMKWWQRWRQTQFSFRGGILKLARVENPARLHKYRADHSHRRDRWEVREKTRITKKNSNYFCFCFHFVADFPRLKCSFELAHFRGDPRSSFQTSEWSLPSGFIPAMTYHDPP